MLPSFSPVVANVPPGFSSYHQLTDDHAYGSAILIRDSIAKAGKLDFKDISNFAACVATSKQPLRLSSIYLSPTNPNLSATVPPILGAVAATFTIIGSDANAKSLLWNITSSDKRGFEFESMLAYFKMNLVNPPATELDFTPSGTSFVDLTLVGDKVRVHRWLYLATPSLIRFLSIRTSYLK